MFFQRSGPVWETLRALQDRLDAAGIGYVVIGGLALNAHGYHRQTIDVDVVMTAAGFADFERRFAGVYARSQNFPRRFTDAQSEVTVDVLIADEVAGNRRKNKTVRFPSPAEAELHDDIPTVSLTRLIELKLVTWRYKDWGDVVELIRRQNLPESFADGLDHSVRTAFGECWDQAHDAEYEK